MEELLKIIKQLKFNPVDELNKIVSDTKLQEWILTTIKERQLREEGVGEENIVIGYYSPYTESINPDKKANTHFTLYYTGSLYDSMRIILLRDGFIIDAEGQKDDKNIFELYGKEQNLLGFTDKYMQEFILLMRENTINTINNRI